MKFGPEPVCWRIAGCNTRNLACVVQHVRQVC